MTSGDGERRGKTKSAGRATKKGAELAARTLKAKCFVITIYSAVSPCAYILVGLPVISSASDPPVAFPPPPPPPAAFWNAYISSIPITMPTPVPPSPAVWHAADVMAGGGGVTAGAGSEGASPCVAMHSWPFHWVPVPQ